ncbi:protein disulfide-isomerase precursor [Coemansia sp. RSA 2711]|nr:protein disulfide-isomerase precursor [Coemansia sp. RSA 2711]KAJ2737451.1 protein disulfide-isomerase precursor [Coemansia sp. Cherry 401B]
MRVAWQTVAAALAPVWLHAATTSAEKSAVHVLTDAGFDAWSDAQELALVEFYAPWCVYCQALAPSYERAAAALEQYGVKLAKVDCTEEQSLCEEMDINGYPTLKVVVNGDYVAYNGTREESGIVNYMRRHQEPPLPAVPAKGLGKFKDSAEVAVVGYFGSRAPEFGVLEEVARELRDEYSFGYVDDKGLAKMQGVPVPGIAVYKDGGEADIFTGKLTTESVVKFVRATSVPVLGELSSQTFGNYIRAGIPIGLIFYNTDEMRNGLESQLAGLAREFKRSVSLAFVDARIYAKHARMLDLKLQWPAFAIQDVVRRTKYLLPSTAAVSETELRQFVGKFAEGRLQPDFKSEAIPQRNDGDVFTLVAKQFNEVVFDRTKDVLVLLYAPWCIHCNRMAPAYEELGRSLRSHRNLIVAKMDATANDIPGSDADLNVPGYPTIVLVRANDNRIVKYHGDRSVASFTDFLRQHAAHGLGVSEVSHPEAAAAQPAYTEVHSRNVGFTPKETRHIEL